jgi:hypothetical protein
VMFRGHVPTPVKIVDRNFPWRILCSSSSNTRPFIGRQQETLGS